MKHFRLYKCIQSCKNIYTKLLLDILNVTFICLDPIGSNIKCVCYI